MRTALVVDDSETVRATIVHHLKTVEPLIEATQATNARDGLTSFMQGEFDVVFLDGVFTDGSNSNDILRQMLAHRPTARIVITSARPREHPAIVEGLGLGAYGYINKPVRREAIEKLKIRMHEDTFRLRRIP